MSAMDNDPANRPTLQLSRRSLVAAGALLGALGPFSARKVLADPPSQQQTIWELCTNGTLSNDPDHGHPGCLCFLSGTRLLTPAAEVAIENLRIGDLVTTTSGDARAIRWIGHITVDRADGAVWRADAMPVRVAKGALGAGSPKRDLYLSRSHMIHLDGVLIPIGDLINGETIAAVDVAGDQLMYYHVELETHEVLVAEGVPCESLLTTAEKLAVFDNVDEYYALHGAPADMAPCAPLAIFNGGRSELRSRLRSAVAVVIDRRQPRDIVRDRLEARALDLSRAA